MKTFCKNLSLGAASMALVMTAGNPPLASSHMDAPLITLDNAANTTDVYAFRSNWEGTDYLTTAVAVYPFEEPGIGPNTYRFDDNVRYAIHVALGDDVKAGRPTLTYWFDFKTRFKNKNTILQAYLGPIEDVDDQNQNLTQHYKVTCFDHRNYKRTVLGHGVVPPNNQGLVTRYYNQNDDGNQPAREGVANSADLDRYTAQAIALLDHGHVAFAGQRDDGFYADIQSIFDLEFTFTGPKKPFDSQKGYNVHTIVLNIPVGELESDQSVVGVYATTSRRRVTVLTRNPEHRKDFNLGSWIQVGRQGNPLFNEGFVSILDKDTYSRTPPSKDDALFKKYALNPQLATALGLNDKDREDIAGIFIPDLVKTDLTTAPARLAGNPDDMDFSRLSIFGGDTLTNGDGIVVPGGFPNGRRFGDDVLDIAVLALSAPDPESLPLDVDVDGVSENDISFNKTFPYAATPLNGRNHDHH